jgi:plastocyanin
MIKRTLVLMQLAVLGALVAVAAAPAQTQVTTLRGSVTDAARITLTQNGRKVTRLKPGTYRIVVSDTSDEHNFALRKVGGATRQLTAVDFMGTKTATVKLTAGRWEFFCAPHESFMRGFVRVG